MDEQAKKDSKRYEDVIPEKYWKEFSRLLNSHDKLDSDVRKILFKMEQEEKESFLSELERWIDLGMQEVYYNEKYVKPRGPYNRQLDEWDSECAIAEDHISLRVENYRDYVDENEYPATDAWIERKKEELYNFSNNNLPLLISRPAKFDTNKERVVEENSYSFPMHLKDTGFPRTDLIDDTFRISTPKSYPELQEILNNFREVLDQESFEALLHNIFQFPENPSKYPVVLTLRARNKKSRSYLKHEFFVLYENFHHHFRKGIDKETFGKILFCNFKEDRETFIEERKNFQLHLDNLTKSVRRHPNKIS